MNDSLEDVKAHVEYEFNLGFDETRGAYYAYLIMKMVYFLLWKKS